MTDPVDEVRRHREQLLGLAARRGVSDIRVVIGGGPSGTGPTGGSTPQGGITSGGESGEEVVRLLVRLEPGRPGVDFFAFAEEAEELLGRPVEVGTGHDPALDVRTEAL